MNRIRELRNQHGWTQGDLGKCLGVQKSAVSKYETGKLALTDDLIESLCDIFDVTSDYLLGRSDNTTYESQPQKKNTPTLSQKDKRDISKDLERFMADLEKEDSLMFDGDPLSEEAKDSIISGYATGVGSSQI